MSPTPCSTSRTWTTTWCGWWTWPAGSSPPSPAAAARPHPVLATTAASVAASTAYLAAIPYLALDVAGDLYLAVPGANAVRRIEGGNGRITTVAGTGTAGFSGDFGSGLAAQLSAPQGIAFGPGGD